MVGVIVAINVSVRCGSESAIHLIRDRIRNQVRPNEVKLAQPHFGRGAGSGGILVGGGSGLRGDRGKSGREHESRGGEAEGETHPDLHGTHSSKRLSRRRESHEGSPPLPWEQ